MKYRIVFLLSLLALLSFFSLEHYSFSETTKTYTEVEIDVFEEIEEEDDKKFYNHKFVHHATGFNLDFCQKLKLTNLLYYGIYKPPKIIFS